MDAGEQGEEFGVAFQSVDFHQRPALFKAMPAGGADERVHPFFFECVADTSGRQPGGLLFQKLRQASEKRDLFPEPSFERLYVIMV